MALKISLADTHVGVPAPEAYAKIGKIHGDKERIDYTVETFLSAEARHSRKSAIGMARFSVSPANLSGDLLPALYADLKTREGFQGAEDC